MIQLGKWKNHSQSVDATSPHGALNQKGVPNPISDSLDTGLGHLGSDPGSIGETGGHHDPRIQNGGSGVNNSRKTSKGKNTTNPGQNVAGTSNSTLTVQNSSHLANSESSDQSKKASWSEHVWSKYLIFDLLNSSKRKFSLQSIALKSAFFNFSLDFIA